MIGRLCFVICLCSVLDLYKRIFQALVGFFLMGFASNLRLFLTKYDDFGCGFLVFGCFSRVCNVMVLSFMFLLGFKVLQFGGHYKKLRKGSSLMCFKVGTTRVSGGGDQGLVGIDEVVSSNCGLPKRGASFGEEEEEEMKEVGDEDQLFDVMALRKMVKFQRQRANVACNELEKERMASASAANEAMAMILRLQNEKSTLQMQSNQLQRLVEEKQLYDHDVIQSLQWIIMKHETERSLLEDQLKLCREKLKMYVKGEEWERFNSVCPTPSASSGGIRFEDVVVGSFELDSSPDKF